MSEEIGKHKGAVETLLHEQKELSRILQIVNSQLERHIKALEEAGVDTDQFIKKFQEQSQQKQRQAQENRQSQQQNSQRKQQSQRQNSNKGRQSSRNRSQSSSESDDEKDMEDYFEDDDDSGNRDFSPR
jgi:hypothetical protein